MKSLVSLSLALVALMIGATSIVAAQDATDDTAAERPERPRLDANGDGTIDAVERQQAEAAIRERIAEHVEAADTDGSGGLSREEIQAAHEARRAEREAARAERQAEREEAEDGADRPERPRGERPQRPRRPGGGERGERPEGGDDERETRFDRIDTDGNGELSVDELAAGAIERLNRLFEHLDADGDGSITAEEREAAREARAERRGGGDHERPHRRGPQR